MYVTITLDILNATNRTEVLTAVYKILSGKSSLNKEDAVLTEYKVTEEHKKTMLNI